MSFFAAPALCRFPRPPLEDSTGGRGECSGVAAGQLLRVCHCQRLCNSSRGCAVPASTAGRHCRAAPASTLSFCEKSQNFRWKYFGLRMTQTINYFPTFLVTTFYQPKSGQLFKAGDFAYPRVHPGRHWQPGQIPSDFVISPHSDFVTRPTPRHTAMPHHNI